MLTNVRFYRLNKGFRQADIENLTGISQPRLSLIERGMPATQEEKEKLAKAFNVSSVDLFTQIC